MICTYVGMQLTGCSGTSTAEQSQKVKQLITTSDSIANRLQSIDTLEVIRLLTISDEVKDTFKKQVVGDTLELEFARHLDAFLTANRNLYQLIEQKNRCTLANGEAHKRLLKLRTDIANSAGDRAKYVTYIQRETVELNQIGNHSVLLKQQFDSSKVVIAQFQPEIGRFMSRFAQPVTVP